MTHLKNPGFTEEVLLYSGSAEDHIIASATILIYQKTWTGFPDWAPSAGLGVR